MNVNQLIKHQRTRVQARAQSHSQFARTGLDSWIKVSLKKGPKELIFRAFTFLSDFSGKRQRESKSRKVENKVTKRLPARVPLVMAWTCRAKKKNRFHFPHLLLPPLLYLAQKPWFCGQINSIETGKTAITGVRCGGSGGGGGWVMFLSKCSWLLGSRESAGGCNGSSTRRCRRVISSQHNQVISPPGNVSAHGHKGTLPFERAGDRLRKLGGTSAKKEGQCFTITNSWAIYSLYSIAKGRKRIFFYPTTKATKKQEQKDIYIPQNNNKNKLHFPGLVHPVFSLWSLVLVCEVD